MAPPRRPGSRKPVRSHDAPARARPDERPPPGLPDREALAAFIREAGETDVSKIARHFGLKGEARRALRTLLKSMQAGGDLGRRGRKGVAERGAVPEVGVADVVERDIDGELYVRLVRGEDAPLVRLAPGRDEARAGAPGMGDRLLVRFATREGGVLEAQLIKRLSGGQPRMLGVVRQARGEVRIEPVDRRAKDVLVLAPGEGEDLRDGDLVLAQAGARRGTVASGPSAARCWRSWAARTSPAPPR